MAARLTARARLVWGTTVFMRFMSLLLPAPEPRRGSHSKAQPGARVSSLSSPPVVRSTVERDREMGRRVGWLVGRSCRYYPPDWYFWPICAGIRDLPVGMAHQAELGRLSGLREGALRPAIRLAERQPDSVTARLAASGRSWRTIERAARPVRDGTRTPARGGALPPGGRARPWAWRREAARPCVVQTLGFAGAGARLPACLHPGRCQVSAHPPRRAEPLLRRSSCPRSRLADRLGG